MHPCHIPFRSINNNPSLIKEHVVIENFFDGPSSLLCDHAINFELINFGHIADFEYVWFIYSSYLNFLFIELIKHASVIYFKNHELHNQGIIIESCSSQAFRSGLAQLIHCLLFWKAMLRSLVRRFSRLFAKSSSQEPQFCDFRPHPPPSDTFSKFLPKIPLHFLLVFFSQTKVCTKWTLSRLVKEVAEIDGDLHSSNRQTAKKMRNISSPNGLSTTVAYLLLMCL